MLILLFLTMFIGCITIIFLCIYVIKTWLNEKEYIEQDIEKEPWNIDIYTDYNRWNNCRNIDDRWL